MRSNSLSFSVLVKKEDDIFVAHCLQLDIVATGNTHEETMNEIIDLIGAQLSYAFSNDNLDYLYKPAPPEVWQQFFACKKEHEQKEYPVKSSSFGESIPDRLIPSHILADICDPAEPCYAG